MKKDEYTREKHRETNARTNDEPTVIYVDPGTGKFINANAILRKEPWPSLDARLRRDLWRMDWGRNKTIFGTRHGNTGIGITAAKVIIMKGGRRMLTKMRKWKRWRERERELIPHGDKMQQWIAWKLRELRVSFRNLKFARICNLLV